MKIEVSDNMIELIKCIKDGYSEIIFYQDMFEQRCYDTFTVEDDINDIVSILGGHKEFLRELIDELRNVEIDEVEL